MRGNLAAGLQRGRPTLQRTPLVETTPPRRTEPVSPTGTLSDSRAFRALRLRRRAHISEGGGPARAAPWDARF
jgi:hypothetical protein